MVIGGRGGGGEKNHLGAGHLLPEDFLCHEHIFEPFHWVKTLHSIWSPPRRGGGDSTLVSCGPEWFLHGVWIASPTPPARLPSVEVIHKHKGFPLFSCHMERQPILCLRVALELGNNLWSLLSLHLPHPLHEPLPLIRLVRVQSDHTPRRYPHPPDYTARLRFPPFLGMHKEFLTRACDYRPSSGCPPLCCTWPATRSLSAPGFLLSEGPFLPMPASDAWKSALPPSCLDRRHITLTDPRGLRPVLLYPIPCAFTSPYLCYPPSLGIFWSLFSLRVSFSARLRDQGASIPWWHLAQALTPVILSQEIIS